MTKLWDSLNNEYVSELPANRYRVESLQRAEDTSDEEWKNDSIEHSDELSLDYASKGAAIRCAKNFLEDPNCSYARVVEIEAVISEHDKRRIEWIATCQTWN